MSGRLDSTVDDIRSNGQSARVTGGSERERPRRSPSLSRAWLVALVLAALPLYFAGLRGSGFMDNEGRYAEVAREMVLGRDWITPHLNGEVFLNKPPLTFWLAAIVFKLSGPGEAARLVSGLATLGTALVLYDLARRLWSPRAGLWSAAVFITSVMTTVEARILRPDTLMTFFLCAAVWGAVRSGALDQTMGRAAAGHKGGRRGLAALWAAVGLGVLTKGLLGLLLPAMALLPALAAAWVQGSGFRREERGKRREERGERTEHPYHTPIHPRIHPPTQPLSSLRRLCPWWGLLLTAAIVLPWHILAGVRNEGFWWDYVVNQHLLVFFDRKFPRDHTPDALWYVWVVFAGRLLPWTVFLPCALVRQWRHARAAGTALAWLPLTWLGTIDLFFSLNSSRLEHYLIPAVPAAALLVGAMAAEWARLPQPGPANEEGLSAAPVGSGAAFGRKVPFLLLAVVGAAALVGLPLTLGKLGATRVAPAMGPLGVAVAVTMALGSGISAVLALKARWSAALAGLVVTYLGVGAGAAAGLSASDPLTSPRALIRRIDPALLAGSEVAYEAGQEYQLCAVLNFYLGRRVVLPAPPHYIPPTYLKRIVARLFTERDAFQREWARGDRRFLLFTDPEQPLDRAADFPKPFYEIGCDGRRLALTNKPVAE